MSIRIAIVVGLLSSKVASAATADETCFIEYHRGFLGEWQRTVVQRSGLEDLSVETRVELVRARWIEPATKVTDIFSTWDDAPIRSYSHTYEDAAAIIVDIEGRENPEERIDPITSRCHFGPSGSRILTLEFTAEFDGVLMEFRNTAEVDSNTTMVVSMMRPLGSNEPFSWHNTLYGVRVNSGK